MTHVKHAVIRGLIQLSLDTGVPVPALCGDFNVRDGKAHHDDGVDCDVCIERWGVMFPGAPLPRVEGDILPTPTTTMTFVEFPDDPGYPYVDEPE